MHKAPYSISTQYTLYYNVAATIVKATRRFNTVGIEVGSDDEEGLRACEPVGRLGEPTTHLHKVSTGFTVKCVILAVRHSLCHFAHWCCMFQTFFLLHFFCWQTLEWLDQKWAIFWLQNPRVLRATIVNCFREYWLHANHSNISPIWHQTWWNRRTMANLFSMKEDGANHSNISPIWHQTGWDRRIHNKPLWNRGTRCKPLQYITNLAPDRVR